MAGPYSFLTRISDALTVEMAAGATTATVAGNFGTPTYKMILTIDGDVPAKAADFECTVAGTALSAMVLKNGPDVLHSAGAQVWAGLVDEHLSGLTDLTGTVLSLAWGSWVPVYGGWSVSPTVSVADYLEVGKWVTATLEHSAYGTSNSTSATVTLPAPAKRSQTLLAGRVRDNGSYTANIGALVTTAGSATASLFPAMNASSWTAANGKGVDFTVTYQRT